MGRIDGPAYNQVRLKEDGLVHTGLQGGLPVNKKRKKKVTVSCCCAWIFTAGALALLAVIAIPTILAVINGHLRTKDDGEFVVPTSVPFPELEVNITEQSITIIVGNQTESVIVSADEVTVASEDMVQTAFIEQDFAVVYFNETQDCYVTKGATGAAVDPRALRKWKVENGNRVVYETTEHYEESKWPQGWIPDVESVNNEMKDLCPSYRLKYMKKLGSRNGEHGVARRRRRQAHELPGGSDHPMYTPAHCGNTSATLHVCPPKVTDCHVTLRYPCLGLSTGDGSCMHRIVPVRLCYTYYSSVRARTQYCCNKRPPCNPFCADMTPRIVVRTYIRAQNSSFILV